MRRPRKPYKKGTVLVSPSGVERIVKGCDWQFCPHCIESPGIIWTVTLEGKYGKQYTKLRDLTSHKTKPLGEP